MFKRLLIFLFFIPNALSPAANTPQKMFTRDDHFRTKIAALTADKTTITGLASQYKDITQRIIAYYAIAPEAVQEFKTLHSIAGLTEDQPLLYLPQKEIPSLYEILQRFLIKPFNTFQNIQIFLASAALKKPLAQKGATAYLFFTQHQLENLSADQLVRILAVSIIKEHFARALRKLTSKEKELIKNKSTVLTLHYSPQSSLSHYSLSFFSIAPFLSLFLPYLVLPVPSHHCFYSPTP